ncbi:DnaJ domain-containing protein [Chloroflexota bacterium]
MTEEELSFKWIPPRYEQLARMSAIRRANAVRWDLDVAIFLFAILIIIIILLFQGISTWPVAVTAIFGLSMTWLVGWRRARQAYGPFYTEEVAKYTRDLKDYYKILQVGASANLEDITSSYQLLYRTCSNETMLTEITEAYEVLSNSDAKASYDQLIWLKYNQDYSRIEESAKRSLIKSLLPTSKTKVHQKDTQPTHPIVQPGVGELRETAGRGNFQINKAVKRAIPIAVIVLLAIIFTGTSFALAKPESAIAAPFRGPAIVVAKASPRIVSLIENIRGLVASFERKVIYTAAQSMIVDKRLDVIPEVGVPTNDMTIFPSLDCCLFPDYVDKRYSQFRYTIDRKGIVTVDTSTATTDEFLEKIDQLLERLSESE